MDEKEFSFINMIPFIDVMLVLLTIVLTTSTFAVTGLMPVELPKVSGKHETATTTNLVEIDKNGSIYFQGKLVDFSLLRSSIASMPRETPFLIRADKDIALQVFVEVLDLMKSMGFSKVSLQTEWRRE
jgi:biopolymer transport protein ExbD